MTQAQISQIQAQMDADPRVQAAHRAYSADDNNRNYVAYLDTIRPYMQQVDQNQYGIEPRSGRLAHVTSKKGHIITMAAGMAAGAAAPYVLPALAGGGPPAAAHGAATGADAAAGGADWGADALAGGASGGTSSGLSFGSLVKWAGPVGNAALGFLENRRAGQANAQNAEAERERQAVQESQLDPFRGYMDQAHDAGRLDWMANQDNTVPPLQVDPKYGANLNLPAPKSYGPSPETRALLRAALDKVAAGDAAPPITPGTQPLPVVKRKKNPADPNSWLYQ